MVKVDRASFLFSQQQKIFPGGLAMLRGVDHIVVAVRDLEAARALYAALGFTVTPTFHHPFGTQSAHVQLEGTFLELLAIEDETLMPPQGEGEFSFARFNLAFLEKRQGASMLVLRSCDRAADLEAFKALGLRTFPPFDFGRKAEWPDGREAEVGFALGFVQDPLMMETGFFVCQHKHPPELFWKKQFQTHRNGARNLASVLFVAHNPSDHHEFLGGFSGQRVMRSSSAGVMMDIDGSDLQLLTPSACKAFYDLEVPNDLPEEGGILGLRIALDMARAKAVLDEAQIPYSIHNGQYILQAETTNGVGLVLCEASD
ncbi:VOC family protein [uncultured Cohaesibacter sp.]|uniref:VOC family protein n=1 Tax=uncultured Cohaesibacter sp. TaxID=1002546 RepID=UPI002AA6192D|nr:VOC family protein [uncultured Cohaesibacter sp.]